MFAVDQMNDLADGKDFFLREKKHIRKCMIRIPLDMKAEALEIIGIDSEQESFLIF